MINLVFAILLAFYPYAISLPASDVGRGAIYEATISAPAGSSVAVQAPAWIDVGPITYYGGDTWRVELRVAADAPDAYGRVVLVVNGVTVSSQGVRVGTLTARRVWLPLVAR